MVLGGWAFSNERGAPASPFVWAACRATCERFLMRGCEALGQLGQDEPWPSWFVDHVTDNGSPPASDFSIDTSSTTSSRTTPRLCKGTQIAEIV